MIERRAGLALAPALLLVASPLQAQAIACVPPEPMPSPRFDRPADHDDRRIMPIAGYLLTLSWSPQYCAGARAPDAFQCRDNRFGFVLHGLWPQGRDGAWPQYCRPARRLSAGVLRDNLCATPSVDLLQHEWAKHGTCVGPTPERYFARARGLYEQVRFPDMARLAAGGGLTVGRFTAAFASANGRALPVRAIRVRLTPDGWLQEVRFCLDRRLRFAACGRDGAEAPGGTRPMRVRL